MRLNPQPSTLPHRPDQERLPQPRHALDQHVPIGQERQQNPADQPILTNENLVDLAQHPAATMPRPGSIRVPAWEGAAVSDSGSLICEQTPGPMQ